MTKTKKTTLALLSIGLASLAACGGPGGGTMMNSAAMLYYGTWKYGSNVTTSTTCDNGSPQTSTPTGTVTIQDDTSGKLEMVPSGGGCPFWLTAGASSLTVDTAQECGTKDGSGTKYTTTGSGSYSTQDGKTLTINLTTKTVTTPTGGSTMSCTAVTTGTLTK